MTTVKECISNLGEINIDNKQEQRYEFNYKTFAYKKGHIVMVDLGVVGLKGCEQKGKRPCVIVQNNVGNRFSPTLIVVPITSKLQKNSLPTHVPLKDRQYHLELNSICLCEQVKVVDKSRVIHFIDELTIEDKNRMDKAILVSFGI